MAEEQAPMASYDDRIAALKAEQGNFVAVEDIGVIVNHLMNQHGNSLSGVEEHLREELHDLVVYIESTRHEIAEIRPNSLSKQAIPSASDELDAIITATREAADKILDAAEDIQEMACELDNDMEQRMTAIATRIYEASTFQDITGQRVTKIVSTLQYLEEKLTRLAAAIGDEEMAGNTDMDAGDDAVPVNQDDLLHGPQLPGKANAQDDIDAILASFD